MKKLKVHLNPLAQKINVSNYYVLLRRRKIFEEGGKILNICTEAKLYRYIKYKILWADIDSIK